MTSLQAERQRRLVYIADMLSEMHAMAIRDGHDLVAHLIGMAQMEAKTATLTTQRACDDNIVPDPMMISIKDE